MAKTSRESMWKGRGMGKIGVFRRDVDKREERVWSESPV